MTTLLRDLIDIRTQVNRGDLVMELSSGVTHPQRTVDQYVVTDQLADSFDQALGIVAQSARDGQSRAAYLHGSFGSGKSHFMAVLHLLLQGEAAARSIAVLAPVLQRHDSALAGTRWLLVPFHMIGKEGMEQAILGAATPSTSPGCIRRRRRPRCTWPTTSSPTPPTCAARWATSASSLS